MLFADLSYRIPDAIYEGHAHAVMLVVWLLMWIIGFTTSLISSDKGMTPNRFGGAIVAHIAVGTGLILLLDSWPNWIIYLTTVGLAFAIGHAGEIGEKLIGPMVDRFIERRKKGGA